MKLETLEYKKLVRMSEVGATLVDRLPALAATLLAAIVAAVTDMARLTATHASAKGRLREKARGKSVARVTLRTDIEALYRTAAVVALENPGFDERFRKGIKGDPKLLTAARAAAEDAAPYAAAFVQHALSPDFLDVLHAHIAGFEQASQDYATAQRACDAALLEIETAMKQVAPASKGFDAMVRNGLSADVRAIAAWDRACLLGRASPARKTKPPAPPDPAGNGKEAAA